MAIMYFVGYDATWKLIVAAIGLVLLGIPQGVNNIITYAMIGDTVDYLEWKTGERGEGICFAMQTLINKIGMAVGAFIGVISFAASGIDAETGRIASPDTLWNMLVLSGCLLVLFPCSSILLQKSVRLKWLPRLKLVNHQLQVNKYNIFNGRGNSAVIF